MFGQSNPKKGRQFVYGKAVTLNFGFCSLGNEQNFLSNQKARKLMDVTRNKLFENESMSDQQATQFSGKPVEHLFNKDVCLRYMYEIKHSMSPLVSGDPVRGDDSKQNSNYIKCVENKHYFSH